MCVRPKTGENHKSTHGQATQTVRHHQEPTYLLPSSHTPTVMPLSRETTKLQKPTIKLQKPTRKLQKPTKTLQKPTKQQQKPTNKATDAYKFQSPIFKLELQLAKSTNPIPDS